MFIKIYVLSTIITLIGFLLYIAKEVWFVCEQQEKELSDKERRRLVARRVYSWFVIVLIVVTPVLNMLVLWSMIIYDMGYKK